MAIATTNRVALSYIAEVTPGVTPATPAFTGIGFTGEGLNSALTFTNSNEIRSDREVADAILTDKSAAGNIDFELTHTAYDWVLEAAMMDVFTTGTLVNGVTGQSYTFIKQFQDVSVVQLFTGMRCKTLAFTMATGAIVTASSSWVGLGSSTSSVVPTGATFTAPTLAGGVMNTVTDVSAITIDGVGVTAVNNLALTIENNLREQKAVGILGSIGIGDGQLAVSGQIDLYFQNLTEYNKFVGATSFALSFTMGTGAGNQYIFTIPNNKYSSSTIVAGGNNQDVIATMAFTSLHDAVSGNTIQIVSA